MKPNRKAFTLIELLIVITIIAIIGSLAARAFKAAGNNQPRSSRPQSSQDGLTTDQRAEAARRAAEESLAK